MAFFIELFFVVAVLSSLYVFTSPLSGFVRVIAYVAIISIYFAIIYFFKDKIKNLINRLYFQIQKLDRKKMLIIILLTSLILKVIFTIFFNFDATVGGDVEIYNEITDHIIETGDIHSDAISHLYGVALHFVLFRLLGLPLHVGLYLVMTAGTLINYFSFEKIIGKEKAFMAVMIYLIMPSTVFMSFCPTHEIFVYFYISLFLFVYNKLLKEENTGKILLFSVLCVLVVLI